MGVGLVLFRHAFGLSDDIKLDAGVYVEKQERPNKIAVIRLLIIRSVKFLDGGERVINHG